MKYSEFKRWLERQGATMHPAKGSHFRVVLNGRQTIFPISWRQGNAETLWLKASRKTWG